MLDIVHADQKLYLVFEFLDVDLKRYMEHANTSGTPISIEISKVGVFLTCAACGGRRWLRDNEKNAGALVPL